MYRMKRLTCKRHHSSHILPSLHKSGAKPPLTHTSSQRAQEKPSLMRFNKDAFEKKVSRNVQNIKLGSECLVWKEKNGTHSCWTGKCQHHKTHSAHNSSQNAEVWIHNRLPYRREWDKSLTDNRWLNPVIIWKL